MDDDDFYRLLSFIRLSPYRQDILKLFHKTSEPQTPKDIADETGIQLTHVSHRLAELRDKELVTVINPDAPRHRYYRLTDKGKEFVEKLVDVGYFEE